MSLIPAADQSPTADLPDIAYMAPAGLGVSHDAEDVESTEAWQEFADYLNAGFESQGFAEIVTPAGERIRVTPETFAPQTAAA